jgi:signal transduction histidine kinase/CheY-like chemotaxis protein
MPRKKRPTTRTPAPGRSPAHRKRTAPDRSAQAEDALRETLRLSTDAVAVVAVDGSCLWTNERCERLIVPEGTNPSPFSESDLLDALRRRLQQPASLDRLYDSAVRDRREVQSDVLVSASIDLPGIVCRIVPFRRNGQDAGRIWFIREQTESQVRERTLAEAFRDLERKKFEFEKRNREIDEAHRQLEEVKKSVLEANRLKSEFLSNMSHELRTPLNSILALSSILLARMDGELTEEQEKQIRIIEKSGKSLLGLINDILDLSKIEAGRMDLIFTEYAVPEFLDNIRSTIQPLLKDSSIAFEIVVDPEIDLHSTDENKLKQILLNLLSNAIKFTQQGKVTLEVNHTKFHDVLEYSVVDTGIGIDPSHFETIFDPFRQIDGSATRKYGGTGLGLAITRKLVELLGGRIWIESEVNKGSRFSFILPAKRRGQSSAMLSDQEIERMVAESRTDKIVETADEQEPAALDPNKKRILVVDDDEESLYIMKKYLGEAEFQMIQARDGEAAVRKAQELQPEVITLDIMMPKKDGWEVLQNLKSDPSTRNIPVVIVSMIDNRKLGYSLGASDYIVKPVVKETLLKHVHKLSEERSLKRILIVDDDLSQAELVEEILESDDFISEVATSGEMALQLLKRKGYDLVILDLLMPQVDGFEVLRALQASQNTQYIPVLVLTGKVLTQEDQQRLSGGNCHIFLKSMFSREKLLENIHRVLEQQPAKPGP